MASIAATSDGSLAVAEVAISSEEEVSARINSNTLSVNANEPGNAFVERIDDAFVRLRITVEFAADLVWSNARSKNDKNVRRIVVQFSMDPGNICVATDSFVWTERHSKPVEMILPTSLTTNTGAAMMMIEVWEVRSEVSRELIGHRRTGIHELLTGKVTTLELTRRRGRTCCGKVGLVVTLGDLGIGRSEWQLQRKGYFIMVVLECQGLHRESDLVVNVNLRGDIDCQLQSDAAKYDEKRSAFIWNHRFSFEASPAMVEKDSISISVTNNNDSPADRTIGTATIQLATLMSSGQTFAAWLPLHPMAEVDESLNARICVACYFLPDNPQEGSICAPTRYAFDHSADSLPNRPMNLVESPLSVPLGSLLEIKIEFICSTSSTEAEFIRELLGAEKGAQQISVRGRIHLVGGSTQRTATGATVRLEPKHCEDQMCAQLFNNDGGAVILRLELNPDVMTNAHPYFSLEILSRRSQKWRASSWIALPYLLKKLSVGVEHQYTLRLFDQEERVCGQLQANVRGGLQVDLLNTNQLWTSNVHEMDSCAITMKVTDLIASREGSNIRCFAKIWTSMAGKTQAQTISSLAWGMSSEKVEAQSISFKVSDIATEIIFVGIYRFSAHERNELLGIGSFSLFGQHMPEGEGSGESVSMERHVPLFAESPSHEEKCGSVTIALQISRIDNNSEKETTISLAATGLGGVSYPTQSGDMQCRFDFEVIEARSLPAIVSEGDAICIQLRIAQSNWKTDLVTTKVVSGGNGTTLASVRDKAHKVVCWSAKDRSFPMLEVCLYSQPPKQNNRTATTSRTSLASGKQVKGRTDWRQTLKTNQRTNEVVAPVLVATGCLNLSSFFSQLNVSVPIEMQLTAVQAINEKEPETALSSVRIPMNLRASSCQEDGEKSPIASDGFNSIRQPIKGDVCIHLLQATGSFLKKIGSTAQYYVSISLGSEVVTSSCCDAGDNTLTWNEQLALPIVCDIPPVIQLTLCQQRSETFSAAPEELVSSQNFNSVQTIGYLTLPIFPSILENGHLLQFELPFGMPCDLVGVNSDKRDPYYHKRGVLSLEMQFLASDQPKIQSRTPSENFELVIHQVRGNLDTNGPAAGCSPGLAKSVFIDFSLMTDHNGMTDNLSVGTTNVISLAPSGMTKAKEVVNLSDPMVAAILSEDRGSVLVGKICDLSGNYHGRVHFPLRSGWRERLVHRKKLGWYSICTDTKVVDVKTTKDALLMSLQVQQQRSQASPTNVLGKFYVGIREVVLEYSSGLSYSELLKLGKYGGASVEFTGLSTDTLSNAKRSRTRQSIDQDNGHHWRWDDEWFTIVHGPESNDLEDLRLSLNVGAQAKQPQLGGTINLLSTIEDATLKRLDQWITLTDLDESDTAGAHLHLVIMYIPTITGTICVEFGESHIFSESVRMLHLETSFFKCTLRGTSYTTSSKPKGNSEIGIFARSCKQLLLPFDSGLDEGLTGLPKFSIQWIGVTKTLGEICLGVYSMDVSSISDRCCLIPNTSAGNVRNNFAWCEFKSTSDGSRVTGVANLRFIFNPVRYTAEKQNSCQLMTIEDRVASAESFAIWKKLYYLLDQNNNGVIDYKEFIDVFVHHLDDLVNTFDGQKLLHLLFGEDNQGNDCRGKTAPTQQQLTTLFSSIDTNHDDEIEWSEYLRFLQQRQLQVYGATPENGDKKSACPVDNPEVPSPRIEQTRELRKKTREDRRGMSRSSSGNPVEGSNQPELTIRDTKASSSSRKSNNSIDQLSSTQGQSSSSKANLWKLHQSSQEQIRLHQQVASLESILTLERRRYAELAADRQALMRSYQQLHLKHQNDIIQEQTKTKWMKQTIERQQQQLEEREALRQKHNDASVVLQSTVRSRLEQKRYHGLKLQRANAAISIQCMVRRVKAKRKFRVLQELDRVAKQHKRAASMLQKFAKFHLHRKEQTLLQEAMKLSATILQKNARRLIAFHSWSRQKMATLRLQCWVRQRLAIRHVKQLRGTSGILKRVLLKWMVRWQYRRIKRGSRKIQQWWRRVSKERSVFHERLEAVICIQSAWKRRATRMWFKRERQRQDKFIAEIEASICIQAVWRGRLLRSNCPQTLEMIPRLHIDTVIAPDIDDKNVFACYNEEGDKIVPPTEEPNDIDNNNDLHGDSINSGMPARASIEDATCMDEGAVILCVLTDITERVAEVAAACISDNVTSEFVRSLGELRESAAPTERSERTKYFNSAGHYGTTGIFLDQAESFNESDSTAVSEVTDLDFSVVQNTLEVLKDLVVVHVGTTLESKPTISPQAISVVNNPQDGNVQLGSCTDKAYKTKLDSDHHEQMPNDEDNEQQATLTKLPADTSIGVDEPHNEVTPTYNTEVIQVENEDDADAPDAEVGLSASNDKTSSLSRENIEQQEFSESSAAQADGDADETESNMPSNSPHIRPSELLEDPLNSCGQPLDAPQVNDVVAMIQLAANNDMSNAPANISTSENDGLGEGREWEDTPIESTDRSQFEQEAQHEMAVSPRLTSSFSGRIIPDQPREKYDGVTTQTHIMDTKPSTMDSMIFTARSSDLNSDEDDGAGTSIDSTDLMMEADAMVTMIDSCGGEGTTTAYSSKHPHRTERLDSLTLLSDFHQLEEQSSSENLSTESPEQPDTVHTDIDNTDRLM